MFGVLMNGCPAQDIKSCRWSSVIITTMLGFSAATSGEPQASATAMERKTRLRYAGCEATRSIPRLGPAITFSPVGVSGSWLLFVVTRFSGSRRAAATLQSEENGDAAHPDPLKRVTTNKDAK